MSLRILKVLLLTASSPLFAERTYLEVAVSTELWDDLQLTLAPEWRTKPDHNEQQYHTDLSLAYALTERWELGIGYRYGHTLEEGEPNLDLERLSAETSYTVRLSDIRLQLRIRYLNGTEDDVDREEFLRYRLKLAYDWDRFNLRPFLAYERQDQINTDKDWNRNAYSGGLDWKINKSHKLTGEYQWIDKIHSRKDYGVFKISYKYGF